MRTPIQEPPGPDVCRDRGAPDYIVGHLRPLVPQAPPTQARRRGPDASRARYRRGLSRGSIAGAEGHDRGRNRVEDRVGADRLGEAVPIQLGPNPVVELGEHETGSLLLHLVEQVEEGLAARVVDVADRGAVDAHPCRGAGGPVEEAADSSVNRFAFA